MTGDETGPWADLVAALGALSTVTKGADADMFGGYKYADLGDIVNATRPTLAEHGWIALTPVHEHGEQLAVTVTLYHSSGEMLAFPPLPFPYGKDAQATGSMITYYRRYALLAALGMAAGEPNPIADPGDDDGAAGHPLDPATRTPGFRSSVVAAVAKLDAAEKDELREWCEGRGIPNVIADMSETQLEDVLDWLMPDPVA